MVKKLVRTGFLLLFLLVVTGASSGSAAVRLNATQHDAGFAGNVPGQVWVEKTAAYDFSVNGDSNLRLFVGYDQKYLYLGFDVKDPFLTFQDDFSLAFQGSDHLRLSFWPKDLNPVTLYLLPSSKIKEPLLNISGASWRQASVIVKSNLDQYGYFLTVAIELTNLAISPGNREVPFQIGVNEIGRTGEAKTYWLFGTGPQDFATLVLSP